ncbi:MAG: hypothetical protein HYX75_24950 [Acidobacteria bacterium]|nr:hypothetical protein [Acidobacteriota bacterium]
MAEYPVGEIRQLLVALRDLLQQEGESNWVYGIDGILQLLEEPPDVNGARSGYKTMCGGYGSFSDLIIWKDDFEDRRRVNRLLDDLRNKLCVLFRL